MVDFAWFARAGREVRGLHAWVLLNRCHPFPVFGPQGTYGSHKFPVNPIVPLPCSQTPVEPRCLAFAALRCCPPAIGRGGPQRHDSFRSSITRPQHWLFTLRAAITGDDAKLASGVWPVFPGWDSSLPTEFCREGSAFRLRLPPGLRLSRPISHLLSPAQRTPPVQRSITPPLQRLHFSDPFRSSIPHWSVKPMNRLEEPRTTQTKTKIAL